MPTSIMVTKENAEYSYVVDDTHKIIYHFKTNGEMVELNDSDLINLGYTNVEEAIIGLQANSVKTNEEIPAHLITLSDTSAANLGVDTIEEAVETLNSDKVDKVTGKGLSTNDFSNSDKSKLDSLHNYEDGELSTLVEQKVDKVTGKGLSTNDFSTVYKTRLDNVPANTNAALDGKADVSHTHTIAQISGLQTQLNNIDIDSTVTTYLKTLGWTE